MARSSSLESGFQDKIRKTIKDMFPGCIIFKIDQFPGMPDLLILYNNTWAALENKKSEHAPHQPNQDYYVELFNKMSFARFIYPENKDQILKELYSYFTGG